MSTLSITDCGDSAVRVVSLAPTADERWNAVHALASELEGACSVSGTIATYDSVLVEFDCTRVRHADVVRTIEAAAAGKPPRTSVAARQFHVPVVFGGDFGPDLDVVATHLGLTPSAVVERLCAAPLTMRCFGSPGGAPMLDGPDFTTGIPRRTSPRPSVAAGSVAVAGRQAVVSARRAPGGWHVVGRTPVTLVDAAAEPLSEFAPGDQFRFVPIEVDHWSAHEGRLRHG